MAQIFGDDGILLRGRYRLSNVIGAGSMATVFRARDEHLGRNVAVKVFRARANNQAELDAAEIEVRLLSGFSHHSLITVVDAGAHVPDHDPAQLFLVMEEVVGEDLKHRLARGTISPRLIAQIGYDIAEGLEYIHDRGVVHCDIKPANILTSTHHTDSTRVRAKLTDFGIAHVVDTPTASPDGVVMGTAAYLSPEQVLGKEPAPAGDVYSLGLVLLECHTGVLAFPGDPVSSAIARVQRDPEIPEHLGDEWHQIISAMTARNPADRPILRDLILLLRDRLFAELGRHRATEASVLPVNEAARMEAVRRYEVLDTPQDGSFDRVTALAARTFSVPIAIVSIVDHDRIWFKSHHGLDVEEIGRDAGLCASAILHDNPWIVEDARHDPRALANPLVASDFGLQFYAGVPLRTRDGYNLGTLCVLDFKPRTMSADEIATLEDLAQLVTRELDLRLDSRLAIKQLSV